MNASMPRKVCVCPCRNDALPRPGFPVRLPDTSRAAEGANAVGKGAGANYNLFGAGYTAIAIQLLSSGLGKEFHSCPTSQFWASDRTSVYVIA